MTEAKIDEASVKAGADLERLKADMESENVNKLISETASLASTIGVNGVPTLVLNNKILQTLDEGVIQEAINAAK